MLNDKVCISLLVITIVWVSVGSFFIDADHVITIVTIVITIVCYHSTGTIHILSLINIIIIKYYLLLLLLLFLLLFIIRILYIVGFLWLLSLVANIFHGLQAAGGPSAFSQRTAEWHLATRQRWRCPAWSSLWELYGILIAKWWTQLQ